MTFIAKRNLDSLSLAPSQTEREKAARTHKMIREHLETDPLLKKYAIDTYLQGSYKNSTNVRGDSDVDMGSLSDQVFYHNTEWLPSTPTVQYGRTVASLRESVETDLKGLPAGSFGYAQYRADVVASLRREYGDSSVVDGNKAVSVVGNTYRLDADVLPCLAFRQYYERRGSADYHQGITFWTKSGKQIVNFPHQHFENLSEKDQNNNNKVKGCIRIFKRIRNELEDKGKWDRKRSPSYYIESLVWNVPDQKFTGSYDVFVLAVLAHLWNDLKGKSNAELAHYSQANRVFILFHPEFWNAKDAFEFVDTVWNELYSIT